MRLLLAALMLSATSVAAGISSQYIEDSVKRAADKVGVPHKLLRAICFAEGSLKPSSYQFSDGGTNNHAIGMCQVLVNTAKDYGMTDDRCKGDFRFRIEDRDYQHCKLFGPYTNALYAAKYLKYQMDRYDGSWKKATAAYNTGTIKICRDGWVYATRDGVKTKLYQCEIGKLLNQNYVDNVRKALEMRGHHVESNRLK